MSAGYSGEGMARMRGWLASRDQGKANKGVVVVGVGLERWVDDGQGSPESKKRVRWCMPAIVPGRGYL